MTSRDITIQMRYTADRATDVYRWERLGNCPVHFTQPWSILGSYLQHNAQPGSSAPEKNRKPCRYTSALRPQPGPYCGVEVLWSCAAGWPMTHCSCVSTTDMNCMRFRNGRVFPISFFRKQRGNDIDCEHHKEHTCPKSVDQWTRYVYSPRG
ncbi:hypothetical protein LIA77_08795 [Sarocladium implicatum]|nr:hypothetical protein LIA77_08795 [Sarocladium implicatum]